MSQPKSTSHLLNRFLQQANDELEEYNKRLLKLRITIPWLTREQFNDLLVIEGTKINRQQIRTEQFVLKAEHEFVYVNLHKFISGDPTFEIAAGVQGDLLKGILLAGNIGCGKSTLMEAFMEIYIKCNRILNKLNAETMVEQLKKDKSIYDKNMLYIDDVGREAKYVKDYGNDTRPFVELMGRREKFGSWTFGTTNYKPDYLEKTYGSYAADRLFKLCNYMVLPGESLRPKQKNINLKLNLDVQKSV